MRRLRRAVWRLADRSPWKFSVGIGVLIFLLGAAQDTTWHAWSQLAGNAVLALALGALLAWQIERRRGQLRRSSGGGPDLGTAEPAAAGTADRSPGRVVALGHSAARWARANPWLFSLSILLVVFGLGFTDPPWNAWRSLVGDAAGGLFILVVAGRLMGLWPNNRLLHWHRS